MKDELKTAMWECNVCDENTPCQVRIVYTNIGLPEHLKKNDRFRDRHCLCKESRHPEWKKIIESTRPAAEREIDEHMKDEIENLRSQLTAKTDEAERLKDFAQNVIREYCWGVEMDGGEVERLCSECHKRVLLGRRNGWYGHTGISREFGLDCSTHRYRS
jgi:hypothetical protein